MLKTLSKLFRLKPYGNQLTDGMSEIWLFLAAVNIVSIAACDAVAWAYFGYTTAHGAAAWLSAAAAGLIVFVLVGSLDAMFVMHDRSENRNVLRERLAVGARIVLVILTFTVTAPFLTQLFFARDIDANIARRNEQTVAAKRAEVAAGFDRRIGAVKARQAARQLDLEKEIAGSGTSGRYGKGPTAAAIEREIDDLYMEVASIEAAKNRELATFDQAVGTLVVLANRYGVDLVRAGPDTRARVVAELEQSESFRTTRLTIKAFLLFMFLGLVCLKLFQPESVRIYFSGRLQAAYARLQTGVFNHRLDPHEHPQAGGMTPIRFADWFENDQQLRDVTDRLRDHTGLAVERLKAQEEAVRVLRESLRLDLVTMRDELAATSAACEGLEQQVAAARHELDVLTARIHEQQQQLDDFAYDVGEDLSLRDQQLLISSRNRTVRQLAEQRAAAAGLTASLTRLTARLQTTRAHEGVLREAIDSSATEVAALANSLRKARQDRLADILAT